MGGYVVSEVPDRYNERPMDIQYETGLNSS